jgi:hypothetical protein
MMMIGDVDGFVLESLQLPIRNMESAASNMIDILMFGPL